MVSVHLFVYGTLQRRSRHPMARLLQQRARYIGPAKVGGRLYDLGKYPGLLEPLTPDDWVHGDLYDLTGDPALLNELDAYEKLEVSEPAFFERQPGEAVQDNGKRQAVLTYWYRGEVTEGQRIVSGRFDKNCET
jgi:gamma-glutamylcyclotransferase (GGCT)/AIG2-like uncharacterized protein YtfP